MHPIVHGSSPKIQGQLLAGLWNRSQDPEHRSETFFKEAEAPCRFKVEQELEPGIK